MVVVHVSEKFDVHAISIIYFDQLLCYRGGGGKYTGVPRLSDIVNNSIAHFLYQI